MLCAMWRRFRDQGASFAKSDGKDMKKRPRIAVMIGSTRRMDWVRFENSGRAEEERMVCSWARKMPKYMFVPRMSMIPSVRLYVCG
jgi:hypothetical protein